MMQELAGYWAADYDWRRVESRLNDLQQFTTEIDGLEIHFVHARSKHVNALPLIITHGWPGSIIHNLKIIDPLTNPTARGGGALDAFHVVIPSMPGYGISARPAAVGSDPARIACAWVVLMRRLGYAQFVAQGGDRGAIVTDVMATQGHPELIRAVSRDPAKPSRQCRVALRRSPRRSRITRLRSDQPPGAPWRNRPCRQRPHEMRARWTAVH